MTRDLKKIEHLLYRLITARRVAANDLSAPPEPSLAVLEGIIRTDERLGVRERVQIYADAYFYRLLGCLKEDFPSTLGVLGEDKFRNLVASYLNEYPPTRPSVFHVGCRLATFLRSHPFIEEWPFIAELAQLERALIDVFHGPDAQALDAEAMRAVALAGWPALKLRTHPALVLLQLQWPVNEVLRAITDGEAWSKPARASISVLVWRQSGCVYYRELEPSERDALRIASHGGRFSSICEAVAAGSGERDPVAAINRFLHRWLADGVLIRADA